MADVGVAVQDHPARRRRWLLIPAALVMALLAAVLYLMVQSRLTFPYDGPSDPVRPGELVQVRAPDGECGPLIVSLHSPSILGRWNQTHSGNAVDDSFRRDEKPWWWSTSSSKYFTPVPCSIDGATTFTLPSDTTADVVAACDTGNRCAKVRVDHDTTG